MTKFLSGWTVPIVFAGGLAALIVPAYGYAQQQDDESTLSFDLTDSARLLTVALVGEGQERYVAIDDLGERHESAATVVPALQKLLADNDPQVRWRSARALGDYESQAQGAAGILRGLLLDKDPIVQYHAAVALGRVGDTSDATIQSLVGAVTSPDGRVARAAISAIRSLEPDPKYVVAALKQVLTSDDDAVVLHAIEAMVERGGAAVPLLNEALNEPETAYIAAVAIEHIGPDAKATVPGLTELLGDTKHSQLLIQTLLALASIGPDAQSAAPQIVPLLKSANDDTIPVAAAYALGSIGATDADAELKAAVNSDNAFLQMTAAWALAKNDHENQQLLKQAVAKLTQGLGSDDAAMQMAAAKCLESLHAPAEMVAPALIALANDSDPHMVDNVVTALASRGEAVVPKAANALKNPELRDLAAKVIAQVGPKASAAVGPLVEAAEGADPEFRADIHIALAAIGPKAGAGTDVLVEALSSDDERVRHSALFALRQIGPNAAKAAPKLIEMLDSAEGFDQLATAWALTTVVPAKERIAPRVVPVLRLGLADPDAAERLETISAIRDLGKSGAALAEDLKRVAANDPDEDVRTAATDAVKKIGG
ncbi:MAG: HEAT repeat domain-containing protein [Pirellulales bacterium]